MINIYVIQKALARARSLSHVRIFVTPWTRACQAPLSMEFSRQEDWSKLLVSTPGDFPDPGIEPTSLAYPVLASMGRTVIKNSEDVIIDRIF